MDTEVGYWGVSSYPDLKEIPVVDAHGVLILHADAASDALKLFFFWN